MSVMRKLALSNLAEGSKIKSRLDNAYFARKFSAGVKKMLILMDPGNPIAFSQVYPFLYFENEIFDRHQVEVRAVDLSVFMQSDASAFTNMDTVCFQTWFNLDAAGCERIVKHIRASSPNAKLVFLDWFAPLDLRLAPIVNQHIDFYVKKQVYSDLGDYQKPTLGDTNLVDYFGRFTDGEHEEVLHPIPSGFYNKLLIGPSFFTSPYMLPRFLAAPRFAPSDKKDIDLHARLANSGARWYAYMRNQALNAVKSIPSIKTVTETGVPKKQYFKELSRSKMCLSAFGYGEICWRDYEAILSGALLVKPNVDHLKTQPSVFVDKQYYVSVAWDCSDLQEKVEYYLDNPQERQKICNNAFDLLHNYLVNNEFIDQMEPLFVS